MPVSKIDVDSLRERVRRIAESGDFSLDDLLGSSTDVIVFGSRAAGLERADSDLDVLAIGTTKLRRKRARIDLICVPESDAHSIQWRHSEIFRHIAAYGISLKHNRVLIDAVVDGYAATRKLRRLESLTAKLMGSWDRLNEGYKVKYLTKLRREFQRYKLLESGAAVPPTAYLDSQMTSQQAIELMLEELLQLTSKDPATLESARRLFLNEAHRLRAFLL